ncbi:MAG: caspase family protein [Bacteroidota bacterium]
MSAFKEGFALIIGVGNDLPTTATDAKAIADTLLNPEKAGYPAEQVILLTEQQATKEGILDGLAQLSELIEESEVDNKDATLFVYYSGHGWKRTSDDAYFFQPYDADFDDIDGTFVAAAEVLESIDELATKKQIVILDACYAGNAKFGVLDIRAATATIAHDLDMGSGRILLASSTKDQKSYIGRDYSVFTEVLIEALNGAATHKNIPFVTFANLWQHLSVEVPQRAAALGSTIQQVPVINVSDLTPTRICRHAFVGVPDVPKVFLISSGSDKDAEYLEGLQDMLKAWANQGVIQQWDATKMLAGSFISNQLEKNLKDAEIVVGLISVDYLNDDDDLDRRNSPTYRPDIKKAMVQTRTAIEQGKAFIPFVVRYCPFQHYPEFKGRNPIPKKRKGSKEVKPVSAWPDKDAVYDLVVEQIITLSEALRKEA